MRSKKSMALLRNLEMRLKKSGYSKKAVGAGAAVMVCVATAAMLIAARHSPAPVATAAEAHQQRGVMADLSLKNDLSLKKVSVDTPAGTSGDKAAVQPSAVTITGCLVRDDEQIRLKNTTGADAPKSRSWKSGFLKKGSASIDVVEAPASLQLPSHIGERVTVSGMLADREMHVRSLRKAAGSCS
jgi:hypothetical protein